jgi:hypothetical protein
MIIVNELNFMRSVNGSVNVRMFLLVFVIVLPAAAVSFNVPISEVNRNV